MAFSDSFATLHYVIDGHFVGSKCSALSLIVKRHRGEACLSEIEQRLILDVSTFFFCRVNRISKRRTVPKHVCSVSASNCCFYLSRIIFFIIIIINLTSLIFAAVREELCLCLSITMARVRRHINCWQRFHFCLNRRFMSHNCFMHGVII